MRFIHVLSFCVLFSLNARAGNDDLFVRNVKTVGDSLRTANVVLFGKEGQMTTFTERDVQILEGGDRARVISVECPEPDTTKLLISSVLSIDVSGSMKAGAPNLMLAKEAARAWIAALTDESDCALTTFDQNANVLLDFTNDKQRLYNALDDLVPQGGTNFNNGFNDDKGGGLTLAKQGRHRRVLVFLTDGNGLVSTSLVAKAAMEDSVTIYCVSLGEPMPPSLIRITEQTGGLWFQNVTTVEEATLAYRRIYADATGFGGCKVTWQQLPTCEVRRDVVVRVAEGEWSTTINQPANRRSTVNIKPASVSFAKTADPAQAITFTAAGTPTTIRRISLDRTDLFSLDHRSLPVTLKPGETLTVNVRPITTDTAYQIGRISVDAFPCPLTDVYVSIGDPTTTPKKQTLRVVHPNGGERFPVRSGIDLTWEGLPPDVPVRVEISTNGGYEWREVARGRQGNQVRWGGSKIPSDSCLVRVTHLKDDNINTKPVLTIPGGAYFQAIFSPDGKYIVSSESTGQPGSRATRPLVKLWDAQSGKLLKSLGGGEYLLFSEDNSLLVTWDHHDVRAYAMPAGTELWKMDMKRGVELCATDRKGTTVLVAGGPGDSTYIIDAKTGTIRHTLERSVDRIYYADLSRDGKLAATAEYDGSIIIFDAGTGQRKTTVKDEGVNHFFTLKFSPDAKVLATTASHGRASLWDVSTGKRSYDISRRRYINDNTYIAFTPDGSRIAVESNTDQTSIFDVESGQPLVSMRRPSDVGGASGADFLGDGGRMFVNVLSKVSVFDAYTGVQMEEVKRGGGMASAPASGDQLLVIDPNRNLQVYDLRSPLLQQDVSDGLWVIYETAAEVKEVDFGPLAVGQARDSSIRGLVRNLSRYDTLVIKDVDVSGTHAAEFSHSLPSEFRVPPQDSVSFNVAFHPATKGDKLATLVLRTESDRLAGRLVGKGILDLLSARSGRFDLGRHPVGTSIAVTIDSFLVNDGDAPVRVTGIKVVGPNDTSFSITTPLPIVLSPGNAHSIPITFIPRSPGRTYTRVAISIDGLADPVYAIVTAAADSGDYVPPPPPPASTAVAEQPPLVDPTTFRSIMLPTSIIPKAGTLTTGIYDVIGIAAMYSVTDFLAIQAGGVIPIPTRWFGATAETGTVSSVWSVGARAGFDVADKVTVGGGYQMGQSTYDQDKTDGLDSKITFHGLWATGGYGTDDSRLNAYLGYAFKQHVTRSEGTFNADAFIYGLAYDYRLARSWKVCGETFFMRSMDFVPVTITLRYFRETDAIEFGFTVIAIPASGAPPPTIPLLPMISWVKRW